MAVNPVFLGVSVDHLATLRQAGGTGHALVSLADEKHRVVAMVGLES